MKKIACLLVLANGIIGSSAQPSSDSSREKTLPGVVVRSPYISSSLSPVTISNVSRHELLKKNYGQEPSLILSQTPSVTYFTDAGSGWGYSYFRMRGIDQTRINMSLNGVPLNEPEDQGVYFSNFPDLIESVSAVQIQRGTGSGKQGVASYGGSIYFESLLFKDSAEKKLSAGLGSFGSYRLSSSIKTGIHKGFGAYLRASHLHSDGYKDHSANTSNSVFFNPGYWGDKHKLYIISFYGQQENELAWIGAPMDSIQKNPRFNANSRREDDVFRQLHVQLHHDWQLNKSNRVHTGVFYNKLKGNYDFDLNNFLGLPASGELYNYAFSSDFIGVSFYHTLSSRRMTWYNGLNTQWYHRRHRGSEHGMGILYGNTGYRKENSAFSKLLLGLGKWELAGELQYRQSSFSYKGDELMPDQRWNFLNAAAAFGYAVKNNLRLYVSLSQTHREPTRNDLFLGNDNLSRDANDELLFNPVKAEKAIDLEAGVKLFVGRGHLYGNLYVMHFKNEITLNGQVGPSGVPLHANASRSTRAGMEVDASYAFKNGIQLRNQSAVSFNRIRENALTIQPVLSPSVVCNQEIRLVSNNLETGLSLRYQGQSFIDYANTTELPAYAILNADANYRFRNITIFIFVNNIFNKRYYTNGLLLANGVPGYFVQAGLNAHTGIRLTW